MEQTRYTRSPVARNGDGDEYGWSYTLEKSLALAQKLADRADVQAPVRIDVAVVEITPDGVETLDSEPDIEMVWPSSWDEDRRASYFGVQVSERVS